MVLTDVYRGSALGGAYYALKAVAVADPANAEVKIAEEHNWQSRRIPKNLRQEIFEKHELLRKTSKVMD